jgi:2-dehydropantoate 2-reductase
MKIGIVGAGGIGGYLAAKLTEAGTEVALLARGGHLQAIREGGLRLIDPDGDLTVTPAALSDDPAILEGADLIVIGVKGHQMAAAIDQIAPHVGPETRVLPFQNGVDAPDMLAEAFGRDRALIGAARFFANITAPGVITRYGQPKSFVFGTLDGDQTGNRMPEYLAAFRAAGIDAPDNPDVRIDLWGKFVLFNAASSTTAGTRQRFGTIRANPASRALVRRLMQEVWEVGRATGVPLPEDMVEKTFQMFIEVLPEEGRTSTAHDLEEGRALEIDYICGAVARRGRALGVDVTASETVFALLAPYKDGLPE